MIWKNFEELKDKLLTPKKIVILPHKNPDGDAIGSTLAMNHYLTALGHECNVISPNDFPKFLKWMPQAKKIVIAEYTPSKARKLVEKAEIIFILDFNNFERIDELGLWVQKSKAFKALIDHHREPSEFDFMYSDVMMPATCQMVYHFMEKMGHLNMLDKKIAQCIYTGIMTDTGNFRFRNTSSTTHRIVAELIDKEIDIEKIYSYTYDTQSPSRLKLLGATLDSIELFPEHRTALMSLTRKEMLENGFQKGDTEGFVNYGLGLQDYVFSVIFIEDTQHDFIKISFRSKGTFDVNEFARKHFSGGGHINAAGGRSDESMEKTKKKLVDLLSIYKDELQKIKI